MERDVDAFLEEVRSSEKLLQELQERLRSVVGENERLQAEVAALKREQQSLGEEGLRSEQELAAVTSRTLLQDVRLKKVLEYKTQVRLDLEAAEAELTSARGQLEGETNKMCSEAGRHLDQFGLSGVFHTEIKQRQLDQLSKTKAQTEQLSCRIQDLKQHESILQQELDKLSDTEKDIENKRLSLRQPLQSISIVHDLQQTLRRLTQKQRDGRHLEQLQADISDAEDETTCLRSAAAAMSAELQRLEQLLWFNNMEKMKQRMRATAKCPGQYHCSSAGVFGEGGSSTGTPTSVQTGSAHATEPWKGRTTASTLGPSYCRGPAKIDADAGTTSSHRSDDANEELDLPQEWSVLAAERSTSSGAANPAKDETAPPVAAPESSAPVPPHSAPAAPAAPTASGGAGPSAAELAQRRWSARRALMMACRQPSARPPPQPAQPPPQPAQPPPQPAQPTPQPAQPPLQSAQPAPQTAPPLASVRPQLRPQSADPIPAARRRDWGRAAAPGRRDWGRAAAPGRLSYRGPQPSRRAPDFCTGLQKLRQRMAEEAANGAATPQKRVRFSTEPSREEEIDCDEMEDFV